MDGPRSLIWDQSENRLHVQKALLVEVLGGGGSRHERIALRALQGRPASRSRGRAPGTLDARARPPTARRRGSPPIGPAARRHRRRPGQARARPTRRWRRTTAALDRAPEDEGALRGRAELLAATGVAPRRPTTLDRLAGVLERAGRTADACDVARRALELAESRGRRQLVGRWSSVSASRGDRPSRKPWTCPRRPGGRSCRSSRSSRSAAAAAAPRGRASRPLRRSRSCRRPDPLARAGVRCRVRRRRSSTKPATGRGGRGGPSSGWPVPRRHRCLLSGPGHRARPTRASISRWRSCTSIAAGGRSPPRSCC